MIALSIDDGPETIVDQYGTTRENRMFWQLPVLPRGNHVLRARADRRPESGVPLHLGDPRAGRDRQLARLSPAISSDGIDGCIELLAVLFKLGFMVERHAEALHHRDAPRVRDVGDGDDARESQRLKSVCKPRGGRLCRVAVPPVVAGKPPADLDVGVPSDVMQAAHPEEHAVRLAFYREQA